MDTPKYIEWKSSHVCQANHAIFKLSTTKYNLEYTNYLGDGNSSSLAAFHDAKPYGPDVVIYKLECIEHIQSELVAI